MTTSLLALLGLALVLVAIPFGLMLAPLAIGIILLWSGLRRADRAMGFDATSAAR